jgi:hypothetical protein
MYEVFDLGGLGNYRDELWRYGVDYNECLFVALDYS